MSLFSSETLLTDGSKAANGFEALAELDLNQDGQVDAIEASAAGVLVWRDTDGDGFTDAGELAGLEAAGVASISTGFLASSLVDAQDNAHRQQGTFTTTTGETRAATDVWFATDPTYSVATDWVPVSDAVAALPDAAGYGLVRTLHQAMARDSSGELQGRVEAFTTEPTVAGREALLVDLVYRWAGVQDIDPASRANAIYGNVIGDARIIEALERFTGQPWQGTWCWGEKDPNPHALAVPSILEAWGQLKELVYGQLAAQSFLKPRFDAIAFAWDDTTQTMKGDLSGTASGFLADLAADRAQAFADLAEFARVIKGLGALPSLDTDAFQLALAGAGAEVTAVLKSAWDGLAGTMADDTLYANQAVSLFGLGGNDVLVGDTRNDVLDGGAGNDQLYGDRGNDVYRFGRGDGQDVIYENDWTAGNQDAVVFDQDLLPADIHVTRNANDLILEIAGTTDRITVASWFVSGAARIEEVRFAEGTAWSGADLEALASVGTELPDYLVGTPYDDLIAGLGGSDAIFGLEGNDELLGGNDADTIIDSAGNDRIDAGAGDDTVYDYDGSDMILGGEGNDTVQDSGQGVNLIDGGSGNDTLYHAYNAQNTLLGGDGDDYIRTNAYASGSLSNTLHGGTGNDTFISGSSSDTYLFNRGDGQDLINDYGNFGGTDRIVFGPGITLADLKVFRAGDDLVIRVLNPGPPVDLDQIIIQRWYTPGLVPYQRIESLVLDDGTNLTETQIQALATAMEGTEAGDTLAGWEESNIILGFGGNDTITDSAGNDVIDAGSGDDTVNDYNGSDTILVGDGNDKVYDYGTGVNLIDGGAGNDTLYHSHSATNTVLGGAGDDYIRTLAYAAGSLSNTLQGGAGNDTFISGSSSDTYLFNRGDGQDLINDYGNFGGTDRIVFGPGITLADLKVSRAGEDLVIRVLDPGNPAGMDQITIQRWYNTTLGPYQRIEAFAFEHGDSLTGPQVQALATMMEGTAAGETLSGWEENNTILALGGNDTIMDSAGNDVIDAGDGNDTVNDYAGSDSISLGDGDDYLRDWGAGTNQIDAGTGNDTVYYAWNAHNTILGGAGNDYIRIDAYASGSLSNVLEGGSGNDTFISGSSSDTYRFERGDGQDKISDYGNYGGFDELAFTEGVDSDQVWFTRSGNHLEVSVIGEADKVTIENWYLGSQYHMERFTAADGKTLLESQVQNLVNAMAAFSPPAPGETSLPPDYQAALAPVLAANWQ